jgi:hypothetical protein
VGLGRLAGLEAEDRVDGLVGKDLGTLIRSQELPCSPKHVTQILDLGIIAIELL